MTNGTDILLIVNGDAVAALTSNDFNCEIDVKDITTKDSAGWRECKPLKKSFNATANGFIKGVGTNIIRSSENLANTTNWNLGTNTIVSNYAVDAFGKKTATLINFTSAHIVQSIDYVTLDDYVTFSLYAKGSGTIVIKVQNDDHNGLQTITLTSTLTRYSVTFQSTDGVNVSVEIYKGTATSAVVSNLMVNIGQTALPYQRSGITYDELYDLEQAGTKITMLISDQVSGDKQYSGSGFIKSLKQTDPVEDISTFSCSIEGTAQLIKSTI